MNLENTNSGNGSLPSTHSFVATPQIFKDTAISTGDLLKRTIQPREPIVGSWFRQGDIGFVFGQRGKGKTFNVCALACSIASGQNIAGWEVSKSRRVCYVDGEMTLENIQARIRLMSESDLFKSSHNRIRDNLIIQHYEEILAKVENTTLNLTDREQQLALLSYCISNNIEVLVLDNLSALFRGVKENEADDWEKVLFWLLEFRRNRISVIVVAHAGRQGDYMRGTSKREDAADWVLQVKSPSNPIESNNPTAKHSDSIIAFTKNREGTHAETEARRFIFTTIDDNMTIRFQNEDSSDEIVSLISCGVDSCTEIAKAMNISPSQVSKVVQQLKDAGKIRMDGRHYRLT